MPLEQLRVYKPALYRAEDFQTFWEATLSQSDKQPLNAELIPYDLRRGGSNVLRCGLRGLGAGGWRGGFCGRIRGGNFRGCASITGIAGGRRGRWI